MVFAYAAMTYLSLGLFFSVLQLGVYLTVPPHTLPSNSLDWLLAWPCELVRKCLPPKPPQLAPIPIPKPPKPTNGSFSQREREVLRSDLLTVRYYENTRPGVWLRSRIQTRIQPTRAEREKFVDSALDYYATYYEHNGVGPDIKKVVEHVLSSTGTREESQSGIWIALMILRLYLIFREWQKLKDLEESNVVRAAR